MRLDGKFALVTGGGSGIGREICLTFAREGAHVAVNDLRPEGIQETIKLMGEAGARAVPAPADVADSRAVDKIVADVVRRYGTLDILVNNAGIGHVGTVVTTGGGDLDRLYAVNVRGVFNTSKAFIDGMLARKSGVIVNVASIGGILGIRDRLAYVTTKTAVVGLTKAMAMDHASDGIRVNCVCPGRVETPFVKARLKEYPDPDAAYREMAGTQAIGRMGRPEEIAAAVLYLASDEAAFITGTPLLIDGGWSMGK